MIVLALDAEFEVRVRVCNSFFKENYARFDLVSVVDAGLGHRLAILDQPQDEVDVIVLRENCCHGFKIYSLTNLDNEFGPAVPYVFLCQINILLHRVFSAPEPRGL